MKRYLSTMFLILSALILIIGLRFDYQWSGIASWGLSLVCLIFAAYFTKYIPNEKREKNQN
ncbi:hypothetical protein [Virgibacillus dakarensis]|uniref:hypothetical protein n=1 Tax=Virgibacillus dakarensis TaxID=1917889 RepID=UPI000B43A496|nr:hypothetical protein [Virgibacillus dakarensis]